MPTHDGKDIMDGNKGNGYAKITLISYWLYKKAADGLLLKLSVFALIFHLL